MRRLRLFVASLFVALLLVSAPRALQALMRIYTNVPIASFPQAMRDAAASHFFADGYLNVKSAPYSAKGDGATDDSAAFLSAIRDAYENNLVVYVPTGIYLISRQLRLVQTPQGGCPGQRKFAHIVVGQKSRSGRPVLKLKDGASLPGPFIEFVHERSDPATGRLLNEPERHYNATFRGLAIDMGNSSDTTPPRSRAWPLTSPSHSWCFKRTGRYCGMSSSRPASTSGPTTHTRSGESS